MEIGILLSESLRNVKPWHTLLKKMDIPDAKLLALETQDRDHGGSAAGNVVWLLRSLGRTYSRTRELLKVFY